MFGFENSRQYSETDILQPKVFHLWWNSASSITNSEKKFSQLNNPNGETMKSLPLVRCKSMLPFQNQQKLLSVNYDI